MVYIFSGFMYLVDRILHVLIVDYFTSTASVDNDGRFFLVFFPEVSQAPFSILSYRKTSGGVSPDFLPIKFRWSKVLRLGNL